MDYKLRKTHRYIWLLLALIIPVFLFFSIRSLSFNSSESVATPMNHSNNSFQNKAENEMIKISTDSERIELILKSSLKNASALVYTINNAGKKDRYLGQLTSPGTYNFTIEGPIKGIVIFDSLKTQTITKLLF